MRFYVPPPDKPLISLTPLIDVVFILLIFFMLASSFMDWRVVGLKVSVTGTSVTQEIVKPVAVRLRQNGKLAFEGKEHKPDDLPRFLKQTIGEGITKRPVVISVDGNVVLQTSIGVLEKFAKEGFDKVSFAAPEKTGAK